MLGVAVVLFVSNRVPVELVAVGAALALYATGVLGLDQALAGFGDPTVVFIATLFVVSEGLAAGGVTAWAGHALVGRTGGRVGRLLVLLMLAVAALTAFISVNRAVAALLPVGVMAAMRLRTSPSRLLLPMVFGAQAGSMLALTGTPVNVIVADAAADAGVGRFGYFAFALVGIPLLAGTVGIVLAFGSRLVPTRTPRGMPPDFSDHARTLVRQYGGGMVVLLVTGVVRPAVTGLLASGAMLLLRILTIQQAYRGVSWTAVVLVAGMIPLSKAMQETGAAERIAEGLVSLVGEASPYLLVLTLCLLTAVLGQMISNTATALIVIPVAVSAAADAGVSARPVLMGVGVAAVAAFLTPVATPANLMVQEPGGYRFGDYWPLRLPLLALFLVVATFLPSVFRPF